MYALQGVITTVNNHCLSNLLDLAWFEVPAFVAHDRAFTFGHLHAHLPLVKDWIRIRCGLWLLGFNVS